MYKQTQTWENKENELPHRQNHEHQASLKKQRSTSRKKGIQHPEEPIAETQTKWKCTPSRTDAEKLDAASNHSKLLATGDLDIIC